MDLLIKEDGTVYQVDDAAKVSNSLLMPTEFYFDAFSRERNDSELNVNPSTAMSYSSVWQAVQMISSDVARIAFNVFSRDEEDNRQKQMRHPAWRLLNRKANRFMTAYTLRETLQSHALLWGNGYAKIMRDMAGRPILLECLSPACVKPVRRDDGVVVYEYKPNQKEKKTYSYDEILHIRGLGDDLAGYSVISKARNSIGLGMNAERFGNKHFAKGARPNVVLKHPQTLNKEQADALVDAYMQKHSGPDNVGRPALASGGLDIMALSMSNTDSQWLESREFQRAEIASWFGIPPHKLGDNARVSYNSIEAEERAYVSQTLMRWFERWETEVDIKLLTERQLGAFWYTEHNVDALIQGDFTTQANTAIGLRTAMIITQNEARQKFNLPSVDGGDTFENPATSSGADSEPEEGATPEAPEAAPQSKALDVHRELIRDRMASLIRTEATQVERNCARAKDPVKAIENLYREYEGRIVDGLRPCVAAFDVVAGKETGEKRLQMIASSHCKESQRSLAEMFISGTPQNLLKEEAREKMADWPEVRSSQVVDAICGVNHDDEG